MLKFQPIYNLVGIFGMKEDLTHRDSEPLNLSVVDTFVFDYGGVVSFHYCEPWQGNLSRLLNVTPDVARRLLSESGELGRAYRMGDMSRDEFWNLVIEQSGAHDVDPSELEYNWAMSYQIDPRMIELINRLRNERGAQVGLLSNSDEYRQNHNEGMYGLSGIFDFMISSHTHRVVKPEREAYMKMLEVANRLNKPRSVVYIDDRERNVSPGEAVGIQGYVFTNYEEFRELLRKSGILGI